jgi:hypothetical protein
VFVIVVALTVDEPTGFDPKLTVPGVIFGTLRGSAPRRRKRLGSGWRLHIGATLGACIYLL